MVRGGTPGVSCPDLLLAAPPAPSEFSSSVLLPPPPEMYQFSMVETAPVGTLVGRVRAEDADVGENTDMAYQIKEEEEGAPGPFQVATDSSTQEALVSLQQVSPEPRTGGLPCPGGRSMCPPPSRGGCILWGGVYRKDPLPLPCMGPNARGRSREGGWGDKKTE